MTSIIRWTLRSFGYEITPVFVCHPHERAIMEKVKGLTATSPGRMVGLVDALPLLATEWKKQHPK